MTVSTPARPAPAAAAAPRTSSPFLKAATPSAPALHGRAPSSAPRRAYLDNLRIALAGLVVAHHAGQAYGPTGGSWPIHEAERAAVLGPFFSVNESFFMGLFFFLSAYFWPVAYDRKGVWPFLRTRLLRLGAPLLAVTLLAFGPITYAGYLAGGGDLPLARYLVEVYIGRWHVDPGHLWFVSHLLGYAVVYAAGRTLSSAIARRRHGPAGRDGAGAPHVSDVPLLATPGHVALAVAAVVIGLATFVLRIWYPIDRWTWVLGVFWMHVAHLPQYVALVLAGLLAYRHRWLERLPTATGTTWLWIGLSAAALRYAYALSGLGSTVPLLASGGWDWRSLVGSLWEGIACVGLSVGLLTLFRQRGNVSGRLLRELGAGTYAVYIVHVFVVVGLQAALAPATLPPLAKFVLVTLGGVALSFGLAAALRRAPLLRAVL